MKLNHHDLDDIVQCDILRRSKTLQNLFWRLRQNAQILQLGFDRIAIAFTCRLCSCDMNGLRAALSLKSTTHGTIKQRNVLTSLAIIILLPAMALRMRLCSQGQEMCKHLVLFLRKQLMTLGRVSSFEQDPCLERAKINTLFGEPLEMYLPDHVGERLFFGVFSLLGNSNLLPKVQGNFTVRAAVVWTIQAILRPLGYACRRYTS